MRIAYFDTFSGASGDMILAALLDAGLDLAALQAQLAGLQVGGFRLEVKKELRHGIMATRFIVHLAEHHHEPDHGPGYTHSHEHSHEHEHDGEADPATEGQAGGAHEHSHDGDPAAGHDHPHGDSHSHPHNHAHDPQLGHSHEHHHRTWSDIRRLIEQSNLPAGPAARAIAIFERLAVVEAAVHGSTPNEVRFHEVGAVDSIVDIVGAALAMDLMGIEKVYCSAIPVGSGLVKTAHGLMPIPAPATAALLKGVPLRESPETGELTTPTGAAILTTLAESFGPLPAMNIERVGTGTGTRHGRQVPNLLRVMIGDLLPGAAAATEAEAGLETDSVWVIETNLDDTTPEVVADACRRLMAAGALDVYTTAINMKKGRTGLLLGLICHETQRAVLERMIFDHTGTFGLRRHLCTRSMLRRRHETAVTRFGPLRLKIGLRGDQVVRVTPEYEDCRQAAETHGVSVQAVMQEAVSVYEQSRRSK